MGSCLVDNDTCGYNINDDDDDDDDDDDKYEFNKYDKALIQHSISNLVRF